MSRILKKKQVPQRRRDKRVSARTLETLEALRTLRTLRTLENSRSAGSLETAAIQKPGRSMSPFQHSPEDPVEYPSVPIVLQVDWRIQTNTHRQRVTGIVLTATDTHQQSPTRFYILPTFDIKALCN